MVILTHFFQKILESFENKTALNKSCDLDFDKRYFVKIPYIGPSSHDFKNKIIKHFSNYPLIKIQSF